MKLHNLPKDLLFNIGKHLDVLYLYNLCQTNKRLYEKLYGNEDIWYYKTHEQFSTSFDDDEYFTIENFGTNKKIFFFLFRLHKLKEIFSASNLRCQDKKRIKSLDFTKFYFIGWVSISYSNFKNIPRDIYLLSYLQQLLLVGDGIKHIPREICFLKNLKVLDLSNNHITIIPKEIGLLQNLEELNLHNNLIENIPEELCQLEKLQQLFLAENRISHIPREIGNLINLRILILFSNNLLNLPIEINKLKKLRHFNVEYNNISNLHEINLFQTEYNKYSLN